MGKSILDIPPKEMDKAWEMLLHEDQLFARRVAYFAALQGLLVAAYITSAGRLPPEFSRNHLFLALLPAAGIAVSVISAKLTKYQLRSIELLKNGISANLAFYADIRELRREPVGATEALGYSFSAVFAIIWAMFLAAIFL